MKQETKELIDWIKKQINIAKTNNIDYKQYDSDYDKAVSFLDSLPEIEAKLCRGGYIQDKNGVPCCEGDKVKFFYNNKEMEGILVWSIGGYFYVTAGIIDYDTIVLGEFEKVEK